MRAGRERERWRKDLIPIEAEARREARAAAGASMCSATRCGHRMRACPIRYAFTFAVPPLKPMRHPAQNVAPARRQRR